MQANDGKALTTEVDGDEYERLPIQTHVVMPGDRLDEIVDTYAKGHIQPGDVLFITEKIVAITQGRSMLIADVKPRRLAHLLAKFVTRTPYGIGLGMPETMEMALRECGTARILFAALVSAFSKKVLRRSGDFYRVAGEKARAIDGPTDGTIEPYDRSVVLGPKNPLQVARQAKEALGNACDVLIVDINDIGGNILGSTRPATENDKWVKILSDNPLGQGRQGTPLGLIRKHSVSATH
jgi:F420-0:gamma-glutamyl ligase-like protein